MSSSTMRLLAVLELLQSRDEITGAEIAERLEVDRRSVRRYIKTIQEMGIPVEAQRGRHGAYRLERGYKLPPLMFTEEEIVALTLGLMMIRAYRLPLNPSSIAGAFAKIERTIPKQFLDQLRGLQETVHFNPVRPPTAVRETIIEAVSTATRRHQRLEMVYQSSDERETTRTIDPYGIVFYEGYWYVSGYCHLRQDLRTFRIDRIEVAHSLSTSFTPPPDFDALAHVMRSLKNPNDLEQVEVLFLTTLDEAQRSLPAEMGTFEETENGVLFRRPAYRLDWVAPMLLNLDFPIRILRPDELKEAVRAFANRAMKMIDDP